MINVTISVVCFITGAGIVVLLEKIIPRFWDFLSQKHKEKQDKIKREIEIYDLMFNRILATEQDEDYIDNSLGRLPDGSIVPAFNSGTMECINGNADFDEILDIFCSNQNISNDFEFLNLMRKRKDYKQNGITLRIKFNDIKEKWKLYR
jgi:hypothetical protein